MDYQHAFEQKDRELKLVLAIDRVRDSFDEDDDPVVMLQELTDLLRIQLATDACVFGVLQDTSDDFAYLANSGFAADEAEAICRAALELAQSDSVQSEWWAHTLGVRVVLRQYPLGGLVLARRERPFSDDDRALLTVAESQIDSAVMQARRMWQLRQRNRELEAIYELDRLRDMTIREMDLIAGFSAIALAQFRADVCLLLLTESPSGELVIRGVIDEQHLPQAALDSIREAVAQIGIPQTIPTPPDFPALKLLAAPLVVSGARLGAVVVGREADFSVGDHRLLFAMMSQMDSALAHSRAAGGQAS